MAGQPTTAGANKMLDGLSGRATQTAATTYLALCTTAPTDSAGGTELTTAGTNGYSRQAVTWSAPSGDPSSTSNSGTITFGPFSADLGNVTHLQLMDASTGGNVLFYWTADAAKDPQNGDSITIANAALTMTAD
jgi:hypothetical protein